MRPCACVRARVAGVRIGCRCVSSPEPEVDLDQAAGAAGTPGRRPGTGETDVSEGAAPRRRRTSTDSLVPSSGPIVRVRMYSHMRAESTLPRLGLGCRRRRTGTAREGVLNAEYARAAVSVSVPMPGSAHCDGDDAVKTTEWVVSTDYSLPDSDASLGTAAHMQVAAPGPGARSDGSGCDMRLDVSMRTVQYSSTYGMGLEGRGTYLQGACVHGAEGPDSEACACTCTGLIPNCHRRLRALQPGGDVPVSGARVCVAVRSTMDTIREGELSIDHQLPPVHSEWIVNGDIPRDCDGVRAWAVHDVRCIILQVLVRDADVWMVRDLEQSRRLTDNHTDGHKPPPNDCSIKSSEERRDSAWGSELVQLSDDEGIIGTGGKVRDRAGESGRGKTARTNGTEQPGIYTPPEVLSLPLRLTSTRSPARQARGGLCERANQETTAGLGRWMRVMGAVPRCDRHALPHSRSAFQGSQSTRRCSAMWALMVVNWGWAWNCGGVLRRPGEREHGEVR